MYDALGYHPPWVAYYAISGEDVVGGGAFVGAPSNGRVEIAYFTLTEHEGCGHAGRTASELIRIARLHEPDLTIRAKTLPANNPSTRILSRLGFRRTGWANDHEIGQAWLWELMP